MGEWMQEYLDAWNSHDGSKVAEWMVEDATYEDVTLGVVHEGRDAIKRFVEETDHLAGDYHFTAVSVQQTGDRYAAEWEMAGTHTGEVNGVRATHKPFRIRGVSIGQLDAEGKIQQNRDYWNAVDLLTQLGVLPQPGSLGERVMRTGTNLVIRLRERLPARASRR